VSVAATITELVMVLDVTTAGSLPLLPDKTSLPEVPVNVGALPEVPVNARPVAPVVLP
jgi:hypothetical protein